MRRWYGLAVNGVLIVLVIGAGAAVAFYGTRLSIADAESGTVYKQWLIKERDVFAIEFIHSVNNSPVKETFIVAGDEIRPIANRFAAFGAGMQSELEAGQQLTRDGEFLVITGFTASYKELNYIVGTVSDHVLSIHNETISLRELCGKNAHISIRVKRGFL
ncbi:MAG: DUF1850 domain-containing protein [Spirochaetaceae bacterium]|jgi:hypothetical protein|nr:DUF1850 domain-containing protein [Spirochaetaceae bacterium]